MEALDHLEKRIDSLSRMLGPLAEGGGTTPTDAGKPTSGNVGTPTTENIVNSLLSAQTLLAGATAGRESTLVAAMQRAPELEKYLDPNFLEQSQQVRAKEVYLNAIAPDLHAQCEQLEQIKQLEPTLGAEYFRNIPGSESTDKLKQIAADNAEFAQQSELIEESLILAMKRYGELQTRLLDSMGAMNRRLEVVEQRLAQRKRDDLERELPVKEEEEKK